MQTEESNYPKKLVYNNIANEPFSKIGQEALKKFLKWCDKQATGGDLPIRGRIFGALVTLNRLIENYDLDRKAHTTKSGAQVKTQTPHKVKSILADLGEKRPIPSEAGRTNRGSLSAVEDLLNVLKSTKLSNLDESVRKNIIKRMMQHLVWIAGEYHERARIAVEYDPTRNASQIIRDTLDLADDKTGAVAQHLVGAKLQIRFPNIEIANYATSAADIQTGRRGDFEVNDTIFHVTVSPNDGHYEKCAKDVHDGYRVYLLVRDDIRIAAEKIAHTSHSDKITVQSIESFIGQNLDELSDFSSQHFKNQFRKLLELYNKRVSEVESEKSLLIEIPSNLSK